MKKAVYSGIRINAEDLKGFLQKISLVGGLQKDTHMTLQFYGRHPENCTIRDEDLGRGVRLKAVGYGELRGPDGRVLNQGLLVSRECLAAVRLSDGETLADKCWNEIPHITLSIDRKAGARAVDTARCRFTPIDPVEIRGTIEKF